MRAVLIILTCAMSLNAGAKTDRCRETLEMQVKLAADVANRMNLNTTRTPEGGPYQPWECKAEACWHSKKAPMLKYDPDHPDADQNGMVAYPNINEAELEQEILKNYAGLTILSKLGACGATFVEVGFLQGIRYDDERSAFDWIGFLPRAEHAPGVVIGNRKTN